eukprot:GEMP01064880.1.p1 GENE.GEMP01064880.1~~GEMP01064880.1.p1  ORF type:complete len:348 (+),score=87.82 GEMP01064880.1:58-1101(+)
MLRDSVKSTDPQIPAESISLWDQLVDEYAKHEADGASTSSCVSDVMVVFVGRKGCGKSTLIDRFINHRRGDKEFPKPTLALDFKFARFQADGATTKTLASIFDFADAGDDDASMLKILPQSFLRCVCCICVDLSAPATVIPSLRKWLHKLRSWAKPSKEKDLALAEHVDLASLDLFPYPLVIFATKWDLFVQNEDAEKRKRMVKALRYFALISGAHLLCTSVADRTSFSTVRSLLRKLLFGMPTKIADQTNINKPIMVNMGSDTLEQIGGPTSPDILERQGAQDFGEKTAAASSALSSEDLKKFPERTVDEVVEQREEDLAFYRQQREHSRRADRDRPDALRAVAAT